MRALGEMAVQHPVSGSFSSYAYEFVSIYYLAGYNKQDAVNDTNKSKSV
jgi:L-asparagine transporter-like permease